jgi:hypothetical protein
VGSTGITLNLTSFWFCKVGADATNEEVEKIQNMICDHFAGRPRSVLDAKAVRNLLNPCINTVLICASD